MKNALIFGLIGLGLISLFVLLSPRNPSSTVVRQTAISLSTSTVSEETPIYVIDAVYPVFGIPALDAKIKANVDAGISEIKDMEANPSPNSIQNTFESTFDSVYIGPDVVSVKLILSDYTGGAHNNSVALGLNYDRSTGQFLKLDDALSLIGKDLQQVSDIASAKLTEEFGQVQFEEGVAPTPQNYATFVVGKKSVRFIFQEYQVEAFAAGQPEIEIARVK